MLSNFKKFFKFYLIFNKIYRVRHNDCRKGLAGAIGRPNRSALTATYWHATDKLTFRSILSPVFVSKDRYIDVTLHWPLLPTLPICRKFIELRSGDEGGSFWELIKRACMRKRAKWLKIDNLRLLSSCVHAFVSSWKVRWPFGYTKLTLGYSVG